MGRKWLITGSQGMLATDLAKSATEAGRQVMGLNHSELNITQVETVRSALESMKPDVVVNTPGLGVDACENDPSVGFRLHTWAARVMARECQRVGAICIYISTCGLFGDEERYYSEYDPVSLKTQYARSKYLGEQATAEECPRSYIIRPGWLFGGSTSHGRNFVYQRYQEALREPVLRSASDKFGSPTFARELAEKILELEDSENFGLYHVTNGGRASRFEYVKHIVESFGLPNVVEPVDSSSFPRSAPVPDCESLDNMNLRFLGMEPLSPWQEAIDRYVQELKRQGI